MSGRRGREGRRARPPDTADGAGRLDPSAAESAAPDPEGAAREICLRLLTRRPHTRAELAAALHRRGVPEATAEVVLARLVDVGLVDDTAFADAWVSSRHAGRGLAGRALAHELRQRGVAAPTVSAAVAALDAETEAATARALVDRRLAATGRLEPAARVRRLVGLLVRKGYPADLAFRVVRQALAGQNAEGGTADAALDEAERVAEF